MTVKLNTDPSIKKILFLGGWKPYYDGIAPPEVMTCTEKKYKCSFLTQSKSWWSAPRPDEHSDLVVFHETDLRRYPPSKPAGQLWAMRTGEAQRNLRFSTEQWNGYFNYTIDHREDATIRTYSLKTIALENKLTRDFYQEKLHMVKKDKLVPSILWYVSNCYNVNSGREEYISELRNLIEDLSIYTRSKLCSLKLGLPLRTVVEHENMTTSTFYLAFENALCKDYVTEKFWKVLTDDTLTIPVVMGGLSIDEYLSIAPPNSFIHVKNFTSPQMLVKHLKMVASDPKAFNYYQEWRNTYQLTSRKNTLCSVYLYR